MIIYPYKIKDEKSEISINLSFRVQHWLSTAPSMRGEAHSGHSAFLCVMQGTEKSFSPYATNCL